MLALGGGLSLFVLLNGVDALSAFFAPIGNALHGAGFGWFDMITHNDLLYGLPDLLLYIGVAAFVVARLRGVWTHYRGLNLFAIFAGSPKAARPSTSVPRDEDLPGHGTEEIDTDVFMSGDESDEALFESKPEMPAAGEPDPANEVGASERASTADIDSPKSNSSSWRNRLRKAYVVLTARRETGSRSASSTGRARDALRILLLPSGKGPDDSDAVGPDSRITRR